jgi:hypothetical protein
MNIFLLGLVLIFSVYSKDIVVFIHPSTVFNISGERFFPAIQNIDLPGWHKITKKSLIKNCYNEVFLPFVNNYFLYFDNIKSDFYMFNWSGSIYPIKKKHIASRQLCQAILDYLVDHPDDELILIGCSHGGSVILGMADLLKKHNIRVSKVILLGTPISDKNNENALEKLSDGSYVFSKIINIYSESDYIQKIDFIFNNYKFCQRILNTREGVINYKIGNIGHINLWHKIFSKKPFLIEIPRIIKLLK